MMRDEPSQILDAERSGSRKGVRTATIQQKAISEQPADQEIQRVNTPFTDDSQRTPKGAETKHDMITMSLSLVKGRAALS